jgi:hypothetical protein
LLKNGCLAGGDVETLPVQGGVPGSGDRKLRTIDGSGGGPTSNGHARWVGYYVPGDIEHYNYGNQPAEHEMAT